METKNFENSPHQKNVKKGLGFRKKPINPKHKKPLGRLPLLSFVKHHHPLFCVLSFAREREKEKNKSAEEDTENLLKCE